MFTSTSNAELAESGRGEVLIPLIRAAATIGFAIAPCSLGFVIIAVSEHIIRSIMVGEDPEMLMSDLQNQFPSDAFKIIEDDDADLVAKVVDLIERPEELPVDVRGTDFQTRVWDALQTVPAGTTMNYTFLAEQIGGPVVSAQADACRAQSKSKTACA
jgi:AraC family transcriptional regulator, regulatory protein of adaptative response / methylated-DNA-[protein]-cysteine methyltransferase